ncbi:hypothetical protein V8C86DRAFT_1684468 [Haematococcus lacustris]
MTTKLYVGNLPWSVTKDQLSDLFQQYGQVEDAFIPTDRETGRPRGFGFVTLESGAAKNAAASLNNTDYQGRTIRVNEAAPPGESRGGGGGGYGAPRRDNYGGGGGYGGGGYGGGGGELWRWWWRLLSRCLALPSSRRLQYDGVLASCLMAMSFPMVVHVCWSPITRTVLWPSPGHVFYISHRLLHVWLFHGPIATSST